MALLRHPDIVPVSDLTYDGDLYYTVQESVPGETRQEWLRRLKLELTRQFSG